MAGQSGDPWAALGGAATGAAAGGISPRLMQAFTRQQELDRLAGDISTELSLQGKQAQVEATIAQPELRALQIQRQIDLDAQRNEDRDASRALREKRDERAYTQAQQANELRARQFEETGRHNRAMENRPTGSQSNEHTVNGAIYRKDENGVYHLAPGSPPPAPRRDIPGEKEDERSRERYEKGQLARSLYDKGSAYWRQAQEKREAARKLGIGSDGQPSRIAATRNEDAIKQLIREAEGLEAKTREVQIEGDKAAAVADSGPQASRPDSGGRTIEGAIEAFKAAKKRAPTADEIARMRKALQGN